jgi:hypothetical protein
MMRSFGRNLTHACVIVATVVAALTFGASSAQADYQIELSVGTSTAIFELAGISGNTSGSLTSMAPGTLGTSVTASYTATYNAIKNLETIDVFGFSVSGSGTFLGYTVNTSTAQTNTPGFPTLGTLQNDSVVTNGNLSQGSINIWLSANAYSMPSAPAVLLSSSNASNGQAGNSGSDSITSAAYYAPNPGNLFNESGPSTSVVFSGAQIGSSANLVTGPITNVIPYSLTDSVTFNLASGDMASLDLTADITNASPAPSSAILAAAGVPILGFFGWMRRRKVVDAAG